MSTLRELDDSVTVIAEQIDGKRAEIEAMEKEAIQLQEAIVAAKKGQQELERQQKAASEAADNLRVFETATVRDQLNFRNNVSAQLIAGFSRMASLSTTLVKTLKAVANIPFGGQDEATYAPEIDRLESLYVRLASGNRVNFLRTIARRVLDDFEKSQKDDLGRIGTPVVGKSGLWDCASDQSMLSHSEPTDVCIEQDMIRARAATSNSSIFSSAPLSNPVGDYKPTTETHSAGTAEPSNGYFPPPIPQESTSTVALSIEKPTKFVNSGSVESATIDPVIVTPPSGGPLLEGKIVLKRKRALDEATGAPDLSIKKWKINAVPGKPKYLSFLEYLAWLRKWNDTESVVERLSCAACQVHPPKDPRLAKCLHLYCNRCLCALRQEKKKSQLITSNSVNCCQISCGQDVGRCKVIYGDDMRMLLGRYLSQGESTTTIEDDDPLPADATSTTEEDEENSEMDESSEIGGESGNENGSESESEDGGTVGETKNKEDDESLRGGSPASTTSLRRLRSDEKSETPYDPDSPIADMCSAGSLAHHFALSHMARSRSLSPK